MPYISPATRIKDNPATLIDRIFASILLSGISDHFPCVVDFKILNKKPRPPRYVYKRSITESSLDQYRSDLRTLNIHTHLKADLMTDPNSSYQIFENLIQKSYQRHFPEKRAKFNKYQHKLSNWITTGILNPLNLEIIYTKDWSCVQLTVLNMMHTNIAWKYIKEYYVNEFTKYKNDVRKTWDTHKGIICKNNMK